MKSLIIEELKRRVNAEMAQAKLASDNTASYARDGDVKTDGKYDTRGIEAGYLAGAQEKRVEELKAELQMLEELPVREFAADDEVALGALVGIELNGQTRQYFISSTAGGTMLSVAQTPVLVISVFSSIGDAALGLKVGEEFELETPQGTRQYCVKSIE
jgi:transcription elongation GreA/GreB family factor